MKPNWNLQQFFSFESFIHWLQKHVIEFIVIIGLLLFYIGNRYICQQYILKIDRKQTVLQDLKYRHIVISATLQYRTRQTIIKEHLLKQGIILEESVTPPYELNLNANNKKGMPWR